MKGSRRRPPAAARQGATAPAPPSRATHLPVEQTVALVITAAAIVLLWVFVTHAPALWRDEVSSVHTQQAPTLVEMWRRAEFESFPLLWMLLLRGWLALGGTSDVALRVFGLIGPAALLGGLWFAAARIGGAAPVVSLGLVVFNAELFRWSATLRPWGLGAGLALAGAAVIWDMARTPSPRRIAVAALVALLSVHCLYQNSVFLAASIAAAVAVCVGRRDWRTAAIAVGIGVVCALTLAPYTNIIQRRSEWNALGMGAVTFSDLAAMLSSVLAAPGTHAWLIWIALMIAMLLSALWSLRAGHHTTGEDERRDVALYALVLIVTALAGVFVLYRQLRYPTQSWYYLGIVAMTGVLAEAGIRAVAPARVVRPVLLLGAAALVLAGAAPAWRAMQQRQTNVDAIAARLEVEAGARDLVLVVPWYFGVPLARYYQGPATVMTIPPIADRTISRYDLLKQQMLTADPTKPLRSAIDRTLSAGQRVWIVGGLLRTNPGVVVPDSLPPPPLPDSEWNSLPYELVWSQQVARWLLARARNCQTVDPGVTGHRLEHSGLVQCSGWR
jgi:hypothetical protein